MDYDAIVIGGGHNGLVAAGYLAKAGERVLVLETRDRPGGACTTEELIAGSSAKWSSCAFIAGLLRPEIIAELELKRFGLELYQGDALGFALFPDGEHLMFSRNWIAPWPRSAEPARTTPSGSSSSASGCNGSRRSSARG